MAEIQKTITVGHEPYEKLWADLIASPRSMSGKGEKIPDGPGWLTPEQYAAMIDCRVETARIELKNGFDLGKFERFKGRKSSGSTIKSRLWYRPLVGSI